MSNILFSFFMKVITPQELASLIKTNSVILIDVREGFEHKSVHIANSVLLPLSRFKEGDIDTKSGKKIVFYCKSGRRSMSVASKIKNHDDFYSLEGGIESWIANKFDVVRSEKKHLPLDRQTQLSIGVIILIASTLSYCVNINFVFLLFAVGCGLSIAGLTGFCGLAMILVRAPWNKCYDKNIKSCSINKCNDKK